jgi:hypothetical protein
MAMQVRINPDFLEKLQEGMPDIALDTSLRAKRRLGKVMGIHGPYDPKGQLIADGLVRLVDKTVLEYKSSRTELMLFFPDGYIYRYYRAQDHFETFVQCMHRVITYLDELRKLGYCSSDGVPLVARARDLEPLRDSVKKSVRDFRNNLEHLDREILAGNISQDEDVGPKLGSHEAFIGGASLAYVDCVRWCNQVHEIAARLSLVHIVLGPLPEETSGDA